MGKYLKLFDTHSEYETFKQTEDFILPNVSHCITENHVHYNPVLPFEEQYLTFDILTDGTITWKQMRYGSNTIYASLDNGNTWQTLISDGDEEENTLNVVEGDKIIFKGENDSYGYQGEYMEYSYWELYTCCPRLSFNINIVKIKKAVHKAAFLM